MKYPPPRLLIGALLLSLASAHTIAAGSGRTATGVTIAQAERNSVELKQGMSLDDVQRLLGKPRRTSLRSSAGSIGSSPAVLQWIYTWENGASSPTLHIDFSSMAPQEWRVNSWEWAAY